MTEDPRMLTDCGSQGKPLCEKCKQKMEKGRNRARRRLADRYVHEFRHLVMEEMAKLDHSAPAVGGARFRDIQFKPVTRDAGRDT